MRDSKYHDELVMVDEKIARSKQSLEDMLELTSTDSWWSTTNAMTVSASVLVFGFLICLLVAFLLKNGIQADTVLKVSFRLVMRVSIILLNFKYVSSFSVSRLRKLFP